MAKSQYSSRALWSRSAYRKRGAERRRSILQRDYRLQQLTPPDPIASLVLIVAALLLPIPVLSAGSDTFQFVDIRLIDGPCCTDQGIDLVVDEEGSVLVSGMRGSLDFDRDGKIDMPTFGAPDAFISKVSLVEDSNTGWSRGPGGPKLDRSDGIASDRQGGVYAVGMFTDSLQMTDSMTLHSQGGRDGFVARYGRDSELMWGRAVGGVGQDQFLDVASDSKGNVILIGLAGGPVDVDQDGNVDIDADKDGQALVVSYSPNGDLRWIRGLGGDASSRGMTVSIGPNDEIYIGGWYRNGAPDIDGDGERDLPVSAETTADIIALQDPGKFEMNGFYARLSDDGGLAWVKGVSGAAIQAVTALTIAANGDLIVLGGHTAPADFDGDGVADLEFRSMADRTWQYDVDGNTFLMQVTPDGERVWTKRYTAPARHVTANGRHILLSGAYSGALDVDDDGIPERESDDDDEREGFSMILNEQGDVQQVLTVVGEFHDIVNAAGFSPDGNTIYLTGFTSLGADFDGDGKIESASICHKAGELYLALYELEGPE